MLELPEVDLAVRLEGSPGTHHTLTGFSCLHFPGRSPGLTDGSLRCSKWGREHSLVTLRLAVASPQNVLQERSLLPHQIGPFIPHLQLGSELV